MLYKTNVSIQRAMKTLSKVMGDNIHHKLSPGFEINLNVTEGFAQHIKIDVKDQPMPLIVNFGYHSEDEVLIMQHFVNDEPSYSNYQKMLQGRPKQMKISSKNAKIFRGIPYFEDRFCYLTVESHSTLIVTASCEFVTENKGDHFFQLEH